MAKRLQVILQDPDYKEIQRAARSCQMSLAEWVHGVDRVLSFDADSMASLELRDCSSAESLSNLAVFEPSTLQGYRCNVAP
jgi:hypothetical protein